MTSRQYSTPGNSSSNFYTPQAASTRRSQGSSYFGSGGSQPGYQNFGNYGNASGIGAGSSGINANDGPSGFQSGMNGSWQEPGYQNQFTYGSIGTAPGGGFGDGGFTGGYFAGGGTDPNSVLAGGTPTGMPGGYSSAAIGDPNGPAGLQGGGGQQASYTIQNGQMVQDPYAAYRTPQERLAHNNYARTFTQQQNDPGHQAWLNMLNREGPGSPLFSGGQATSTLGAAMDSGTGAMPTQQEMAAFGNGPAATGVQAQPRSRYEQMAVNPQRMATLPVLQLQNIADNDTTLTSLRGPIADESARLARLELAKRGSAGNQVAVGNQQASDPIEQRLNEMRGTGPFAPDFLDMVTPENIMQAALQGLPNGGYGGGNELVQSGTGGMTMAPGGGGFWQGLSGQQGGSDTLGPSSGTLPNGQPYVLGPSDIPLDPATGQPVRPMQPSPSGKPQNPFEKLPGYVNPQPASQPQPTRTGRPIWGSQPNPYEQPGTAATQSIPGIEGSMAIGPDGKPYGGTPNLSRPEPGGNNLPQNPNGYGNDVFQPPSLESQLGQATTFQQRVNLISDALRNASSLQEQARFEEMLRQNAQNYQQGAQQWQGIAQRGAVLPMPAALMASIFGNPQYN